MHKIWDMSEIWTLGICCQIGASAGDAFILCGMSFFVGNLFCQTTGTGLSVSFFAAIPIHPACSSSALSWINNQLCSGITGSHQLKIPVCKPCPSFFQGISETCSSGSNRICWKSDQSYLCKGNLCKYNCYESSLYFSVGEAEKQFGRFFP